MEVLLTENICKEYKGTPVIEDINIYADEGELIAILGESGCGKTTLFNVISGLLKADSGKVFLKDEDITGKAGNISYMFQKDLLLPHKRLIDNLILPLIIRGENKDIAINRAISLLDDFNLKGCENSYPAQLSGGMRQRAALLRTYLYSKGVALLDEPFSALDAMTKTKLHSWYLSVMKKLSMTTMLITHDVDEALILADRIYIMGGVPGRIISEIKVEKDTTYESFSLTEDFISQKAKILKFFQ